MSTTDFKSLSLIDELSSVLQELGFETPTPIQKQAIPILLEEKDLIAQAQTGSGKTAAFSLPILQKIEIDPRYLQGLILCPTRELCQQVTREIRKLGRKLPGLQVLTLVGGEPGRPQAEALGQGVHIVVGTPGRVLDHIQRGQIDLSELRVLVLDEADKMLEMGFEDEVTGLIDALPPGRQTALFSATFPEEILKLSRRYQKDPVSVKIENTSEVTPQIEPYVYETEAEGSEKVNVLLRVLQQHPAESTVIFCNQKTTVALIAEALERTSVSCTVLHGDLDQRERAKAMSLFRNGSHRILVATDIAARGLDIENLELVVNFELPDLAETYVHRIGRTGRAGKTGVAVTLMRPQESLKVLAVEKLTGVKMLKKNLGFKNQHGLSGLYQTAAMTTIALSGGRKDKLRPGDILGALTAAPQALEGTDIGKIEIQDKFSYVAVTAPMADQALKKLRDGKIKGLKFRASLVK